MKRIYTLALLCLTANLAKAQVTSDSTMRAQTNDTIRIGSILIIKKGGSKHKDSVQVVKDYSKMGKPRVSTNYFIFDLGFANFSDQTTDFTYGGTQGYVVSEPGAPAFSRSDLKLRGGKSINANIWLFMQKVPLVKRNVNLKYGLGLELNNYHFRSPISFKEGGVIPYSNGAQTNSPFVFRDSISFSKNKLAADYLTVPLMLNFATGRRSKLSASFGVSVGYLYSQRNKQESTERGKQKNKGDYDLEQFKFSYIGELGLGPVRFYGSYSPKSMFETGLNVKPYTVGIRFSNW